MSRKIPRNDVCTRFCRSYHQKRPGASQFCSAARASKRSKSIRDRVVALPPKATRWFWYHPHHLPHTPFTLDSQTFLIAVDQTCIATKVSSSAFYQLLKRSRTDMPLRETSALAGTGGRQLLRSLFNIDSAAAASWSKSWSLRVSFAAL